MCPCPQRLGWNRNSTRDLTLPLENINWRNPNAKGYIRTLPHKDPGPLSVQIPETTYKVPWNPWFISHNSVKQPEMLTRKKVLFHWRVVVFCINRSPSAIRTFGWSPNSSSECLVFGRGTMVLDHTGVARYHFSWRLERERLLSSTT